MSRPYAIIAAALAALLALNLLLATALSSAREKQASASTASEEALSMRDEVLMLKDKVRALESRAGVTNVKGIVQAVQELTDPMGMGGKVTSVKPLGKSSNGGQATFLAEGGGRLIDERADITIEGVSMNEMVNLFYAMENAPMLLIVRKAEMKPSFGIPGLLDITMTLSLVRPV